MKYFIKKIITNIQNEFSEFDISERALRKFGLLIGGIVLLIAGVLGTFFHKELHETMPMVGFMLIGFGFIAPKFLLWPYYLWMGIAIFLGFIIGNALMIFLFYVFLTPIAIASRMFVKKNIFEQKSFWIKRENTWTRKSMEKPF